MTQLRTHGPRWLAHAASILALVWMLADFLLHLESYTANRALMLRSGFVGLLLLAGSLACSPIARLLHWPRVTPLRRIFGLYGFLFVALHLGVYAWLENDFALDLVLRDLGERPAMPVGFLAFAVLLPLALTSTRGWQRRLGKRWGQLHKLAYIALPLSVWHYAWLDRDVISGAVLFAIATGALLLARVRWPR
jgi:methionine sulfoxide reductase heme-binding subunit